MTLVSSLQEASRVVRAARASLQIPPEKKLKVVVRIGKDNAASSFMNDELSLLSSFMNASEVIIDTEGKEDVKGALPASGIGFEAFVFVREAIDIESEIKKLEGEIEKNEKLLEGSVKKLSNEAFVSHAKPEAVEKEKSKKAEFEDKIEKAKAHIELLKSF